MAVGFLAGLPAPSLFLPPLAKFEQSFSERGLGMGFEGKSIEIGIKDTIIIKHANIKAKRVSV